MAKFRILKVRDGDGDYIYLVQSKSLFFGWTTRDYFHSFSSAMSYVTKKNPHYIPKPEEIAYECE